MRANKRKWCFIQPFVLILLMNKVHSLSTADFGLPRTNYCLFSYNESVYIIGGQTTTSASLIKLTFNLPFDTTPPTIRSETITVFNNKSTICSVTSSGKAMIATMDNQLHLLDIDTLKVTENVTEGVQLNGLENTALMSFNDEFIMLISNDTFILDTRLLSSTWSQVPTTAAPIITSFPILHATSRWILHFRSGPSPMTPNNLSPTSMHVIDIYLFDPIQLQWLENTTQITDAPSPFFSIIPQSIDSLVVYSNNNNSTCFYTLNVSSTTPTVEISNAWNAQISLSSSSSTTRTNDHIVMIYSDLPVFFNTDTYTILPQPSWLNRRRAIDPPIISPTIRNEKRNLLPILLGSLLGGAVFLGIACMFYFCYYKRKTKKTSNDTCHFESRPYEVYNKERQTSTSSPISEMTSQILLAPKPEKSRLSEERVFKSRFKEHFDIASLPDLKRASTCSLHHTVSTHSTIPRSISSHM